MPISIYALLKANENTLDKIKCETAKLDGQTLDDGRTCAFDKSPHFQFSVLNNVSNQEIQIVVNVRSEEKYTTKPNLLCYINQNFKHEITNKLSELSYGYHQFVELV